MVSDNYFLIVTSVIIMFVFVYRIIGYFGKSASLHSTSLLLSKYTDSTMMMPINQGQIDGMHYSAIAILSNSLFLGIQGSGGLLVRIELPFRTKLHLLNIPKNPNIPSLNQGFGTKLMEEVDLEGEYSNYFSLYCEKGEQTEARYTLDPKAMVFTIDFCRSHSWEIINDEMYFLQTGGNNPEDPTAMWDDITKFVNEIRPAIEDKNSLLQDHLRTPYGQDRRQNLLCPVCNEKLINKTNYFVCPNNDGVLAFGSLLSKLRSGKLEIVPELKNPKPARNNDIKCPACENIMTRVAYNNGPIIIDTCSRCPYRWLDAGELLKKQ